MEGQRVADVQLMLNKTNTGFMAEVNRIIDNLGAQIVQLQQENEALKKDAEKK